MPMNPRLLRPILSGDPDALRYIAAVQAADQQSLEPAVRKAITDFIVGCKQDGIWTALKASCILMGARTLSGALTPLAGTAPTNVNFVSGDYNRKTGLVGDGSTKYLNTNRASNADGQDNFHIGLFVNTVAALSTTYLGADSGNTGATAIGVFSGNTLYRIRNGTLTTTSLIQTGFVGASRAASGNYDRRSNGTTSNTTQASQTPTANNLFVFARNDAGTPATHTAARLSYYSVGSALTLSLLDARVSALSTAIGAAI